MPITIDGTGSISGLSAGGLPDLSVQTADLAASAVTTAKVADANITAAKLSGAQSGSAPIYAARAWVNFDGTGTPAIRASGNVTSITDNGVGDYTVNFTTALPDANFGVSLASTGFNTSTNQARILQVLGDQVTGATLKSTTQLRVVRGLTNTAGAYEDSAEINVAVFR